MNGKYAQAGWLGELRDYERYVAPACVWGGPEDWETALNNGWEKAVQRHATPEWLEKHGLTPRTSRHC